MTRPSQAGTRLPQAGHRHRNRCHGRPEPAQGRHPEFVLLLTGTRIANAMAMQRTDLELQRGLWRVPGEQSKSGEPVVDILRRRLAERDAPDEAGASIYAVGKALGHRDAATTGFYAGLDLSPIGQAVALAFGAILAAVNGQDAEPDAPKQLASQNAGRNRAEARAGDGEAPARGPACLGRDEGRGNRGRHGTFAAP